MMETILKFLNKLVRLFRKSKVKMVVNGGKSSLHIVDVVDFVKSKRK